MHMIKNCYFKQTASSEGHLHILPTGYLICMTNRIRHFRLLLKRTYGRESEWATFCTPTGRSDRRSQMILVKQNNVSIASHHNVHNSVLGTMSALTVTPYEIICCTGQWKRDGTRAENRFRLSAKRTSPFKSALGVSSVDYWQPRCAHQR